MHATLDLRVLFEVKIAGSGPVITDVIPLGSTRWRTWTTHRFLDFAGESFPRLH